MYITSKRIKGKDYRYLAKSIRLPDGKVKTIQKLIKDREKPLAELEEEFQDYFTGQEKRLYSDYALSVYRTDFVINQEQMMEVESMKVDYRYIIKKLTKRQLKDLFDRFTANFTYESNAIEGNSLTLKDVSIVMFDNVTVEGKNLREIYETRNSRKVVDLMLKKKFHVTPGDIKKVHKLLMQDIDTRLGYKKLPNYLLGRNVETTPPEKVEEEITKLIEWYKENRKSEHPLKISALFHGKFERIHPFEDGNGRVGRVLFNVILINNGYPPLIVRKSQRESYLKVLESSDAGAEINLERFFLDKYKKTFRSFFKVYTQYI
jgi:Fic family protein